ncbi:MAG: MGMT family protein [Clostridia bacterium]|nr:MGMT family protein [Clostridia bacterium]
MTNFAEMAADCIARIPAGKVASYGLIALLCGRPGGARSVGRLTHSLKRDLPFHRVVFQNGGICQGDAFGHPHIQRQMLLDEGVRFLKDGRVDMKQCLWDGR